MVKQTRWDRAVDPDGVLPEAERYRRADALREAFYIGQGLKARERNRERGGAPGRTPADAAEERRLRGRMAGLVGRARHDPKVTTAAARAASEARFVRQVDPDLVLSPEERARRADAARRAYFATLLLKSLEARLRRGKAGKRVDPEQAARIKATMRQTAGRVGAYTMLATHDPHEVTRKAQQAFKRRFVDMVDPARGLSADERADRVEEARKDYFRGLAARRPTKRSHAGSRRGR